MKYEVIVTTDEGAPMHCRYDADDAAHALRQYVDQHGDKLPEGSANRIRISPVTEEEDDTQ